MSITHRDSLSEAVEQLRKSESRQDLGAEISLDRYLHSKLTESGTHAGGLSRATPSTP